MDGVCNLEEMQEKLKEGDGVEVWWGKNDITEQQRQNQWNAPIIMYREPQYSFSTQDLTSQGSLSTEGIYPSIGTTDSSTPSKLVRDFVTTYRYPYIYTSCQYIVGGQKSLVEPFGELMLGRAEHRSLNMWYKFKLLLTVEQKQCI